MHLDLNMEPGITLSWASHSSTYRALRQQLAGGHEHARTRGTRAHTCQQTLLHFSSTSFKCLTPSQKPCEGKTDRKGRVLPSLHSQEAR